MRKLKAYEALPDTWIGVARREQSGKGAHYVAWLCLPSWGYGYNIVKDDLEWGQRKLWFLGFMGLRRAFCLGWRFP